MEEEKVERGFCGVTGVKTHLGQSHSGQSKKDRSDLHGD